MSVKHIACSTFVNESERHALNYLFGKLQGTGTPGEWIIFTNLSLALSPNRLPDEIDMLIVGPTGIHPIEIKHWDSNFLKRDGSAVGEQEATKINDKAKRIAGFVRVSLGIDAGFIEPKLLLTRNEAEKQKDGSSRRRLNGVPLFSLAEWRDLVMLNETTCLTDDRIQVIADRLVPRAKIQLSGQMRTFADYYDLELVKGFPGPFHRVYKGRKRPHADKVVLSLYDLTALKEKSARDIARREFEIFRRLQKSIWLPSIMESFQDASGYVGELCFYSYVDPLAATLEERSKDVHWNAQERISFAKQCLIALQTLHGHPESILHRNLSPETIRVKSNNVPILTELQLAHLSGSATVTGAVAPEFEGREHFVAPEVLATGLGACTVQSDIYSICRCLEVAFEHTDENSETQRIGREIQRGAASNPTERPTLETLLECFDSTYSKDPPPEVSAEYWDEETVKELNSRSYKIVSRLGAGSVGITFKVIEVDPKDHAVELSGPYVAKVFNNALIGPRAARAYARVRPHTKSSCLAGVLEVASEWKANDISALLHWQDGTSLSDLRGVLPLYIEDLKEGGLEDVVLGWVRDCLAGLEHLHSVGLVHGDISPKNIIVSGGRVAITDYDMAVEEGGTPCGGTPDFCVPRVDNKERITRSDDVFALAATFFDVIYEKPPFSHRSGRNKNIGINWAGIDTTGNTRLNDFLNLATAGDEGKRFVDASSARLYVEQLLNNVEPLPRPPDMQQHKVMWLDWLQQSYPGSPKGNIETRGLDSDFARSTYVETSLDEELTTSILNQTVRLVVLCGNAGDGKTAFLQNLAHRLGMPFSHSRERVWNFRANGLQIRANLDGSASHEGKGSTELLDEFFAPFQNGSFAGQEVHLLAINDGPLMAWLDHAEDSWLTGQLYAIMSGRSSESPDSRIRFVNLNNRSLVGRLSANSKAIDTEFLDKLIDKMLGKDVDEGMWAACETCASQTRCTAARSVRTLTNPRTSPLVRNRLSRALQTVHQRGEAHITARLLRAAISYMFFGTDSCQDLHDNPALVPLPYWDRAFSHDSEFRQGELLGELSLLDPALDSHPKIDRELLGDELLHQGASDNGLVSLASLRRRAYFEWSDDIIRIKSGQDNALDVSYGRYFDDFVKVGTGSDGDREDICSRLCKGLARLEDLPQLAFEITDSVPIRITPRTPTETAFWVLKPRSRFKLSVLSDPRDEGLDTLHTQVRLTYSNSNGFEEHLVLGLGLFHLLMELKSGYQLTDEASDDIYANLAIFKQRLAQEDDTELYAWNPQADRAYRIFIRNRGQRKMLTLRPSTEESDL